LKFGQWLGLAAIIAAVALLWSLRGLLLQLFAAVVLAMAICTLVGVVRARLGCSRPLALTISLGAVALVLVVGGAVLIPPFVKRERWGPKSILDLEIWRAISEPVPQCGTHF
jgi:predicted PurR-regulated permease PerM